MITTWANLLSVSRLLCAVPCTWAILHEQWLLATIVYLYAAGSDMLDGLIARKLNQSSALGGLIDHTSDATFVTTCLAGMALTSEINPILPALIPLSFLQYVVDSRAIHGKPLRASFLGRWNGISYFVLVGVLIGIRLIMPESILLSLAQWLAWLLVATTLLSMLDRAIAHFRPAAPPRDGQLPGQD